MIDKEVERMNVEMMKAKIAACVDKLESYSLSYEVDNDFWDIVETLRQLSTSTDKH